MNGAPYGQGRAKVGPAKEAARLGSERKGAESVLRVGLVGPGSDLKSDRRGGVVGVEGLRVRFTFFSTRTSEGDEEEQEGKREEPPQENTDTLTLLNAQDSCPVLRRPFGA